MVIKVAFLVLIGAELILANTGSCPDPSTAINLAYKEDFHVAASLTSKVEKSLLIPIEKFPKHVSCVAITGIDSAGSGGGVSVVGIGVSRNGVSVKLVSQLKKGIDVEVAAYTP